MTGESDMGIAEEKIEDPADEGKTAGAVVPPVEIDGATVVVVDTDALLAVWDGPPLLGLPLAEKKVAALSGRLGESNGAIGPIEGDGVSSDTRGATTNVLLIDWPSERST